MTTRRTQNPATSTPAGCSGLQHESCRRARSGFTLLELLIAMTILSLLATTALFGWRIAASAWQKANSHLQESRAILETNQLLLEQMSSVVFYRALTASGASELFFQGEPQTARFVSRYSLTDRASSGLYRIEYQIVEQTDGTKQLLLNEFPVRSRQELGALIVDSETTSDGKVLIFAPFAHMARTRVLLEGLKECRFEYYEPPLPSKPGIWKERWIANTPELPRSIAIRLVSQTDSADLKPVSIVAAIRHYSLGK